MSLYKSAKRLIKKILVYYDVTQKSFTKRNLIFCVDINHKCHNSSLFKTFRPFKESNNLLETREISNLRFSVIKRKFSKVRSDLIKIRHRRLNVTQKYRRGCFGERGGGGSLPFT